MGKTLEDLCNEVRRAKVWADTKDKIAREVEASMVSADDPLWSEFIKTVGDGNFLMMSYPDDQDVLCYFKSYKEHVFKKR